MSGVNETKELNKKAAAAMYMMRKGIPCNIITHLLMEIGDMDRFEAKVYLKQAGQALEEEGALEEIKDKFPEFRASC